MMDRGAGVPKGLLPLIIPLGDLTDSQTLPAQQALDGDLGPMTGGMGAVAPS